MSVGAVFLGALVIWLCGSVVATMIFAVVVLGRIPGALFPSGKEIVALVIAAVAIAGIFAVNAAFLKWFT